MIRRQKRTQTRSQRDGAAMVEMAILLPLFLLLILGTLEIGAALRGSQVLMSAVRGAGRLAAMETRTVVSDGMTANQKIEADIRNFVSAAGMPGEDVIIEIKHPDGQPGAGQYFDLDDPDNRLKLFEIEAQIPYTSVNNFPNQYFGSSNLKVNYVARVGRAKLSG